MEENREAVEDFTNPYFKILENKQCLINLKNHYLVTL